ncbi:DUF6192 family protein [Streptomyces anulatus]|uniref:DUF6192 family protein n=1 Tax=Streptomyces anulatus TaxID=1892 RepID=UPI0038695503
MGGFEAVLRAAQGSFGLEELLLEGCLVFRDRAEEVRDRGLQAFGDFVFVLAVEQDPLGRDLILVLQTEHDGVSHTVHKILASIPDEAERWVAIKDAPFNSRSGKRQWTSDGAKRLVGQQVDRPVTVEEKVRVVRGLTRDDEVAVKVTASLLSRPETAASLPVADRVRVVQELTRDDEVASSVTSQLLQRPRVARQAMRNDDTRFTVNRAQFDNSEETREKIRDRVPAVREIEHTIEYLDLVGSCHQYVATLGRLVPRMRDQEFTEDERETIRRGIAKVRGAADWLEAAIDTGQFTLDEQLAQLLKGD